MNVITILYPRTEDSTFDMDYYLSTHMPLFAGSLGDACTGWGAASIDRGNYAAIGWATVTTKDAYKAAMKEHGAAVMADVPNFTNVQPELLVGDYAGGSE